MKAILALLVGCVWGWRIDLRRATTDPQDLYLSPGDNVDFVLNGESKQGTKWFYYLTNNLIIRFTGQDYSFTPHSSDPEMDNGGTYTIVLSLVATETPYGVKNTGQLRMALAMPFDYDQEAIEYAELSKWTEKTITHRIVNLTVRRMVELDQTSFEYQQSIQKATEGDLYRLTLPEALHDGFRWTTSAHSSPAAPVELLSDRHELGSEETGNIGTRILLFRMNQAGSHTIYLDYVKFTAQFLEPTKESALKKIQFEVKAFENV